MDNDKKSIEELAAEFEAKLRKTHLPEMMTSDLLDLMDYYNRAGMDFEADLCRYIAERTDPENPEVVLTQAHYYADEGDWFSSTAIREHIETSKYDNLIFNVEHTIRLGAVERAFHTVLKAVPKVMDVADYDFLFDMASLFREYGYTMVSINLLELIPPSYIDYQQVLDLRVECYTLAGGYEEAKGILNGQLDDSPFDQVLWGKMATCCYRNGEYDEALEACEYSLAIGSDDVSKRIKNFVNVRTASKEASEKLFHVACEQQDYLVCMEYADRLFEEGRYEDAIPPYCFANLFCPRGNLDREKIISRLTFCEIQYGEVFSVLSNLSALTVYPGEHWSAYYEGAQHFFERGKVHRALQVIRFADLNKELTPYRLAQLAELLAHYNCYEEGRDLWEKIILQRDVIPRSYSNHLDEAVRRLDTSGSPNAE